MLRKIMLALAFTLLPAAAMAQDHSGHHAAPEKKAAATSAKAHQTLAQLLMKQRDELKLTEEQLTKLENLHVKMAEHHKTMHADKAGMKHDSKSEEKMHEALYGIFTEEQLAKVKPFVKKHMEMCGDPEHADHAACKVESKQTKPAVQ